MARSLSPPGLPAPETKEASLFPQSRAAVVHDWLLGMRGGEWLLAAVLAALPGAAIHTLFYRPDKLDQAVNRRAIHPSALSRTPFAGKAYRWLLPLFPRAIERMRFRSDTGLLISLSHCVAHGAVRPASAMHINYCLSPMRYLYDQGESYAAGGRGIRAGLGLFGDRMRAWDRAAAHRADEVWAISAYVAERIERVWGIKPTRVIHPPVRTDRFAPPTEGSAKRLDEYLLVSAMVPYKRVDLAIRAANRLGLPLRVVGGGPLLARMRRLAKGNVIVEGPVGEERLAELYRTRAGLIFPGVEDFGIVPLEAMASGMPVLALRAGGLLETMAEGTTGAFFDSQGEEALAEAWNGFRPSAYDPAAIRAQAQKFSENNFMNNVTDAISLALGGGRGGI